MVTAINESIAQGLTQKEACKTIGLSPRKFRRWANPKPRKPRTAWNKIRDEERDAIEAAAWLPDLIGKPVSHVFVHGHDSGKFFASLSTVYRVLKTKDMVQPLERRTAKRALRQRSCALGRGLLAALLRRHAL